MNLKISTKVVGDHRVVMKGFTRDLFEQLTPPGIKVELVRFDGSETGDIVHLRLMMPLFPPQDWISDIIDHGSNEEKSWFVDKGTTLPWFLSFWEHHHLVEKGESGSVIVDDIRFKAAAWIPDFLMYPVLWLQFVGRKSVYRRVFGSSPS